MRRSIGAVLTVGVALFCFTVPAYAVDSFFDVLTDSPVYGYAPFPDLGDQVAHFQAGTFIHELGHNLRLNHGGSSGGGGEIPFECALSNGAPPGPDQYTTSSFFDITWRPDLNPQPFPPQSFFDVFCELDVLGGGPSHLVPINPGDPEPYFDVLTGDSFFDITYRVEVGPGGGCHELHMHGQIDPALQLHSGSVQIQHPSFNADSFFDVFFTLDLVAADASPSAPVVKITTTGQYLSAPLSVQTASWGEVKSFYRK